MGQESRETHFDTVAADETASNRASRREVLRLAGAFGLAAGAGGLWSLRAARAITVEPEGDPTAEADPEAGTPVGTPVGAAGRLTVYSGRNENLIGPLVEQIEATTGLAIEVRYGGTAELAATILEEGDNSPADVYFAQDAGALGALAKADRLQKLPDALLDRVDPRFRSPAGLWVGTSGRARVLVYNTDLLSEADLPASVLDLTDERWKGKIGWAPENGSFQAFVTALRVLEGEETARAWLEGMLANEPQVFEGNSAIVRAVAAGEIAAGLVNHYYLYEIQAEEGQELPIANHFFAAGDPGALVNVAGVGILKGADNLEQALAFVDALLSEPAQEYFAEQTFEYPLIEGVEPAEGLMPLAELGSPAIDLSDLDDLQGTLELLTDVGAL